MLAAVYETSGGSLVHFDLELAVNHLNLHINSKETKFVSDLEIFPSIMHCGWRVIPFDQSERSLASDDSINELK